MTDAINTDGTGRVTRKPLFANHTKYGPGILLAIMITVASILFGNAFGGPVMLYALIAGMALSPLAANQKLDVGIKFSATEFLKVGVILLGLRITFVDITALGYETAALVIAGVLATLSVGWGIGRALGLKSEHAILSAGAVAICGCSAALAIAAVLPKAKNSQCNTAVTVIGVTILSTAAMITYPFIAGWAGLNDTEAGIFMGTTIHNVAQVIGAGYVVSDGAGETATIVKLLRVACLMPVVIMVGVMFRNKGASQDTCARPPMLPLFMLGFIAVVIINSMGIIPAQLAEIGGQVSQWALIAAVAAMGVNTSFGQIARVGARPWLALMSQTAFLAIFALLAIRLALSV